MKRKLPRFVKSNGTTLSTIVGVAAGILIGFLLRLRPEPWSAKEVSLCNIYFFGVTHFTAFSRCYKQHCLLPEMHMRGREEGGGGQCFLSLIAFLSKSFLKICRGGGWGSSHSTLCSSILTFHTVYTYPIGCESSTLTTRPWLLALLSWLLIYC